jgi:hypothetical protein
MSELEVIATFDTPQTARSGVKLLNAWFSWIMEGSSDETEEVEALFEDFGLSFDDFSIERELDVDWQEIPEAHVEGSRIVVVLDSKTGIDTIRELFEAMGSFDLKVHGEDD